MTFKKTPSMHHLFSLCLILAVLVSCGGSDGDGGGDGGGTSGLTFDVSNAVGIVKVSGTWSTTSALVSRTLTSAGGKSIYAATDETGLKKLKADGTVDDFYSGATLNISDVFISPDGYIYLVVSPSTDVTCVLIKVKSDSTYECVDSTISSIEAPSAAMNSVRFSNPLIQFDSSSAVYYFGHTTDGKTVVRKKATDGTITDYLGSPSGSVTISQFVVAPDGYVYLAGQTTATNQYWVRSISPANALNNLMGTENAIEWMQLFPDNNVYVGAWAFSFPAYTGASVIDTSTHALKAKCWISIGSGSCSSWDYLDSDVCTAAGLPGGCLGTLLISKFFRTPDNAMFAAVGDLTKKLWKLYPTIEYANLTNITNVTVIDGQLGYLVLAGQNASATNKFILFNVTSSVETDLSPSSEIEIYHAKFRGDGKIWLDGLRFSDNKYVVGVVDTSAGNTLTILATTSAKLDNVWILN